MLGSAPAVPVVCTLTSGLDLDLREDLGVLAGWGSIFIPSIRRDRLWERGIANKASTVVGRGTYVVKDLIGYLGSVCVVAISLRCRLEPEFHGARF